MVWEEEVEVARKTSKDSPLRDYKSVNRCLAIEHKCRRDFAWMHNVMAKKWPSRGRGCFDKLHGCRPNFDCVRESFDRQDMELIVIVPWLQGTILASNRDTLVD